MIAAIASQSPDYAGEGREGIRTTDVLRAVRYLPRDHCRAERSLSTVVGRLNAWIIQETQQVAPVIVPTEFVLQPPVVRIRHGTVAEMIGRLSSQPLGLGGKVRRLSSVICLPELHRFSEQAAQTIAEAATSSSLGLHHLTDRAQHVGQTFLLLHPRQSLSIVAPSSIRYHHPSIVRGHHLTYLFVAVTSTNLVHRSLIRFEHPQKSSPAVHSPSRVVGVDEWTGTHRTPQLMVGIPHCTPGTSQRVLADRPLAQLHTSQRSEHSGDLPYRNAHSIVEHVGRRHHSSPYPVRAGPVLVRRNIGMPPSDLLTAGPAPTYLHPVPRHLGSGNRRNVGCVDNPHSLMLESASTSGAGVLSHRHLYKRLGDFIGRRRLSIAERPHTRLAAGTLGSAASPTLGERSRLALSCSLELGELLVQLFLGRRQLRNLPLQLRDQPHQLVALRGREVFGLTHSQSIKTCSVPHNPPTDADPANQLLPNVVKGWDISDDGLTYTLYLREGLRWSNGTPATADDWVWYNEKVIRNVEINPGREGEIGWSGFAPTVKKVDDYTVQLILPERADAFLDELATYKTGGYTLHGRIADGLYGPSHFLKTVHRDFADDKAAYDKMLKDAGFDSWPLFFKDRSDPLRSLNTPVMSPWKMTSPITSYWFEWERNPYYWAVDPAGNQLPYIDKIAMLRAGDKEVLNLRAAAGEIDFQHRHIEMAKVPVFLENAEKGNYQLRFWPSHGAQAAVTFNMTYGVGRPLDYRPDGELQKWLHNKDFRIALALAIDRERINEFVFLGLGKVKNSTFAKGHSFYPGEEYELKYTKQDIAEANRILDTIGLDKKDGDGFRLRTDGRGTLSIEVHFIAEYFLDYESVAEIVTEDWKKIGIKTNLRGEDVALFSNHRAKNSHHIVAGDGGSRRDPMNFREGHITWAAYRNWYTGGRDTYSGGNPAANPTGDPIFKRIVELTDEHQALRYADRKSNYIELQKLNIDNQWVIGIVGDTPAFNGVIVMKSYFKNVPEIAPNQAPLQNPGIGRPQTWFMEGGKNDSE